MVVNNRERERVSGGGETNLKMKRSKLDDCIIEKERKGKKRKKN